VLGVSRFWIVGFYVSTVFYITCFEVRPVWPIYCILQLLQHRLYIPLFSYISGFLSCAFSMFCVVFLTWYVICRLVFLNTLVSFRIMGLWYSNIAHFLFCFVCGLFCVLFAILFLICLFSFSMMFVGYPQNHRTEQTKHNTRYIIQKPTASPQYWSDTRRVCH
jgi:hypothetical protein